MEALLTRSLSLESWGEWIRQLRITPSFSERVSWGEWIVNQLYLQFKQNIEDIHSRSEGHTRILPEHWVLDANSNSVLSVWFYLWFLIVKLVQELSKFLSLSIIFIIFPFIIQPGFNSLNSF